MTRLERWDLKARILKLAELKATGSPAELADRLDISVRSVKRYVSEIRCDGYEIRYCPVRRTYVTEKDFV